MEEMSAVIFLVIMTVIFVILVMTVIIVVIVMTDHCDGSDYCDLYCKKKINVTIAMDLLLSSWW
jgi:hypothetical protein